MGRHGQDCANTHRHYSSTSPVVPGFGPRTAQFSLDNAKTRAPMGKDRRKEKVETDESLGKEQDKYGKKGDGKIKPEQHSGPSKSFTHQKCRHILVQKQGEALRISKAVHEQATNVSNLYSHLLFMLAHERAGALVVQWRDLL